MRKFWLAAILFIYSFSRAHAIDFTIHDATVSANTISLTTELTNATTTNCPDNNCYLQGTLRSVTSSKFFGETLNNIGTWVDYVTSPDPDFVKSNLYQIVIQNSGWQGIINMLFKLDDANYYGPGDYELTLNRYTGKSTTGSNAKSNTLNIHLAETMPSPSPSPTPSPSSPLPATPTSTPTPTPTPTPKPSIKPSPSPSPPKEEDREGTVAGVTTEINLSGFGVSPSPKPSVEAVKPTLNRSRAKTALLVGLGLVLVSVASFFGYRKYLVSKETTV
jgi:hypothetical protein